MIKVLAVASAVPKRHSDSTALFIGDSLDNPVSNAAREAACPRDILEPRGLIEAEDGSLSHEWRARGVLAGSRGEVTPAHSGHDRILILPVTTRRAGRPPSLPCDGRARCRCYSCMA